MNEYKPPIYEHLSDEAKRQKEAADLHSGAISFLMDGLLGISAIPEEHKSGLRVAREIKLTEDYLHETFFGYITLDEASAEEMALQREVVDYLSLVRAGLMSFVESHPFIGKTDK